MDYYDGFRPHVSVHARRKKAEREMERLRKKGQPSYRFAAYPSPRKIRPGRAAAILPSSITRRPFTAKQGTPSL